MSGGSQHNPNGRQSQLGPGWSPLQVQLQMANLLARAPQAHMPSDRGLTWHTPTPPPHLYHVQAPSPPDPLQAMKNVSSNSVFRHTATPPELYRHTPTPPDKHLMRHTPSPGDVKAGGVLPPVDLFPHLVPGRDKLVRADELLNYTRGVDLSLNSRNGAPPAPALASPALSVRDAPTINSLIARAAPRRVDALLERLAPAPVSPHSVIVHSRAHHTPSPPSSNEDSADSCGAPPGSKRKRKPERTVRLPSVPPPPVPVALAPAPAPSLAALPSPAAAPPPLAASAPLPAPVAAVPPVAPPAPSRLTPPPAETIPPKAAAKPPAPVPAPAPLENGDAFDGRAPSPRPPERPHVRRKSRSGSAETIDDIAAMIAGAGDPVPAPVPPLLTPESEPVTVDKLKSVLASPEPAAEPEPEPARESSPVPVLETAAAPRRRSARRSTADATNAPVESPSEAKPAEPESAERAPIAAASSFVEVENQLEKMFAGLEEEPGGGGAGPAGEPAKAKDRKRRRSAPARPAREKGPRKKADSPRARKKPKEKDPTQVKDAYAYDSGSNASSSRSRGPYIQIRGPRDSPVSVAVMNATTGEEEETGSRRKGEEFRNGARFGRGLHASTLGLRYDASTADATWYCALCRRGPHAARLGDLFGPYTIDDDCDEYRALDEATQRRYSDSAGREVWLHAECGVWAPGVLAAGARVWGLAAAVWAARAAHCETCAGPGAPLACCARTCHARAHLPCARDASWRLDDDEFRAWCPRHAE